MLLYRLMLDNSTSRFATSAPCIVAPPVYNAGNIAAMVFMVASITSLLPALQAHAVGGI